MLADKQVLHGKQNTSSFEFKALLVRRLRKIWQQQTGKAAPIVYQGENHKFSLFVTDVIQEVLYEHWSPKSTIEAYKNLK